MDAVYLLKHSAAEDLEIRYSLRSVERHLPWIRKVWIVGDRPRFLVEDKSFVEFVSYDRLAWIGGYRSPVKNMLLGLFLTSLLPELDQEFLLFCDDFILLEDVAIEDAKKARFIQDLSEVTNRGKGLWKESLWRTYDVLKRLKYPGFNFAVHIPTYLTRKWVFDAFAEFRDFVSEDRYYGLLAETAILNYVLRHHGLNMVRRSTEDWYAGFHEQAAVYDDIVDKSAGKRFLNFDDKAFSPDMRRFLAERFPQHCRYETPREESVDK
ncbi:MAG: hypothetical protein ACK5Q5_07940 [Planctomycetaceae bacterium]